MKLPADSVIASAKLTRYLLQWRPEDDKSAFLALAGYTPESAERLASDLRNQLLILDAEFMESTEYGDILRIRGSLTGPTERTLHVVTIWMTEEATGVTKFITLYPDKH